MKLSVDEKNAISSGLLTMATATEMMMRFWCLMEGHTLVGPSKHLFNEMQHGIKHAMVYYQKFMEQYENTLIDMDKDMGRVEDIRKNGAFIARTYLHTLNLNNNGYPDENIEKALTDILAREEKPEIFVRPEVIDQFRIR